jgi:gliding motility-associated-like protein
MKLLNFTLLSLLVSFNCFAQKDTEFWFAAPNFGAHVGAGVTLDRPVSLNITTYAQAATVVIETPAGTMPTQTLNIAANSTFTINLTNYINNIEVSPPNTVTGQGLHITSNATISVYYEISSAYSPELFSLKGKNALGQNFFISSQFLSNSNNTFSPTSLNTFNIVATQNNTQVTINPKQALVGRPANVPFTITLNRGETFAAQSASHLGANHLHGSTVTSNRPIAITLGDDNVTDPGYGTCSDNCGDQTVPVNILGTEYIAVGGNLFPPYDRVYITATEDGTNVFAAGTLVGTINAGQTISQAILGGNNLYINSTKPIYCYLFTGFGCEFGTAILPRLNCTGTNDVSVVKTSNENAIITLVVKAGAQGSFTVNGATGVINASAFSTVPGNPNYVTAKVNVANIGGSRINVKNSMALFSMGFVQGGPGTGCSVGYFSDFGAFNSPIVANATTQCQGAALNLSTVNNVGASYSWVGPNIMPSTTNTLNIASALPNNTGWYYVNSSFLGCNAVDSIYITINPSINKLIDTTICNGMPYLGYSQPGTYVSNFTTVNGCDSIRTLILKFGSPVFKTIDTTICDGTSAYGYNSTGTYINTFTGSNGCDSTRTLNLTVKPRTFTTVNKQICFGQSFLGYTSSGTYVNTFMGSNGCDSVRTLNLSVVTTINTTVNKTICLGQSYLGYTTSGTFTNTFMSAAGCDSVRTLNLIVKPPQFTTENKAICEGSSYLGYNMAGTYTFNLFTAEGCDSTHTLNLTIKPKKYSTINQSICQGNSFLGYTSTGTYVDVLMASNGCDSIRTLNLTVKPKSFNTINPTICEGSNFMGFTTSGSYTVTLVAANNCDSVLTINLNVTPTVKTTINKTICQGQSFEGYSQAGTYNNTFMAASGCDSVRTLNITIQGPPVFTLGNITNLCTNDSIILSPGQFNSYLWQNGSTSPTFTVKQGGLYKVTTTNNCGSGSAQINIIEQACKLYFPNAFTPNADGKNDLFKALNVFGVSKYKMNIYNRYGQILFSSSNKSEGWNGNYKGVKQASGVYPWHCVVTVNGQANTFTGTVTLIR